MGQTERGDDEASSSPEAAPCEAHIVDPVGRKGATVRVTFHGVRGSTPCASEMLRRYGGNTSCVSIERSGHGPILFDMGTGIREYGAGLKANGPVDTTILVSHLHWDHVQGIPFFGPVHDPESSVAIHGPPHGTMSLRDTFAGLMQPPYFPITCSQVPGTVSFVDCQDDVLAIDDAKVTCKTVPHVGATNGYRVDVDGYSIAYVSDHQEPIGRPRDVDDKVLELCDGVDLLIHDAQFTPAELLARPDWGHCTPAFALEVCAQAGVKRLALFHHDPWHDDDMVDALLAETNAIAPERGLEEVWAAAEGLTIVFGD